MSDSIWRGLKIMDIILGFENTLFGSILVSPMLPVGSMQRFICPEGYLLPSAPILGYLDPKP